MNTPPVYVDLDGTLSPSDLLLESCLRLIRADFLMLFSILWWALHGPWRLKCEVFGRVAPDWALLPIRPEVLALLETYRKNGHRLVLASASMLPHVQDVAQHVGIFDHVLGSTDSNLKSREKLQAIVRDCGGEPFVYVGDSKADLPVWAGAAKAVVVAPGAGLVLKAKQQGLAARWAVIEVAPARFSDWLRAMRVQQWAKNALLFLPLLAGHVANFNLWMTAAWAFLAFGLLASATYIWNDLLDLPADRAHHRKKERPFARGRLGILPGLLAMKTLGLAGLLIAWWMVSLPFALCLLVYTAITLMYSFVLKKVVLADVVVLALLYTLRVVAGAVAVQVELSSWLLAISMFTFLSLALVKRCAELELMPQTELSAAGRGYWRGDLAYLVPMGIASGLVAVVVLALYVDSQNGSMKYNNPDWLWAICPLFLYWLMRIWVLTGRRQMIDDPVHFAIYDKVSWVFLVCVFSFAWLAL